MRRVRGAERATVNRTPVKSRPGALRRERHQADYVILVVVVALTAIGILMVYSSSALKGYLSQDADTFATVGPADPVGDPGVRRDGAHDAASTTATCGSSRCRCTHRDRPARARLRARSSTSWSAGRRAGSSSDRCRPIHPAEIAKLALVVYLAHWFAKRGNGIRGFWAGTVPFLVILAPVAALVFKEPDLGTTMVITLTAFTMFFVAGANLMHLVVMGSGVGAGDDRRSGCAATSSTGSGSGRTRGSTGSATGFHTVQGLLALGIGGLFGTGLGESRVFVPNAFNDFIFAEVGQEFGMIGAIVVITLFLLLAYSGVRVALAAPDTFGALLAAGHHRLAVPPGVHQHRGGRGPAADHRDHAAVHQRRRLIPHHQLRGGRDPPLDLARDRGEGDVERRCDC